MKIHNKLYITVFCVLCVIIVQATGKRILFIGDSITDGAWGKSKVWNRGISGNTLDDLRNRWDKDAISLKPDIISILIGTNDADSYLKLDSGELLDMGRHTPYTSCPLPYGRNVDTKTDLPS